MEQNETRVMWVHSNMTALRAQSIYTLMQQGFAWVHCTVGCSFMLNEQVRDQEEYQSNLEMIIMNWFSGTTFIQIQILIVAQPTLVPSIYCTDIWLSLEKKKKKKRNSFHKTYRNFVSLRNSTAPRNVIINDWMGIESSKDEGDLHTLPS